MKTNLSAATLSLVALVLSSTQAAHADESPLDFASPNSDPVAVANSTTAPATIALTFDPPPIRREPQSHSQVVTSQKPAGTVSTPTATASDQDIFAGGSNSLVARTVGSAEGTRTVEGHKTSAYHGHTDPGNGVWNLGSFSYQHAASSPEDADEKQLARLERQDRSLQQQATQVGVPEYESDLTVRLNGIDLANQSPLAALAEDGGGYIDRLKQAQEMGLQGSEAVLWARVRSFLDPNTNRWNAPGLGNTVDGISHDQARRMDAITQALELYQAQVAQTHLPQPATTQAASRDITEQLIAQNVSPDPQPTSVSPQAEARVEQILTQPTQAQSSVASVATAIVPTESHPLAFDLPSP
jgi:hypothetical protein